MGEIKQSVHSGEFWDNVNKGICWEWTGRKNRQGYGYFRKTLGEGFAYRISFVMAHNRPIRKGYHICHTCDNPSCVNPSHLFEGTPTDNRQDLIFKGKDKNFGVYNGKAVYLSKRKDLVHISHYEK